MQFEKVNIPVKRRITEKGERIRELLNEFSKDKEAEAVRVINWEDEYNTSLGLASILRTVVSAEYSDTMEVRKRGDNIFVVKTGKACAK